jgi:hypothetical protein
VEVGEDCVQAEPDFKEDLEGGQTMGEW